MCIIIYVAVFFVVHLDVETTLHTFEGRKCLRNLFGFEADLSCCGKCGSRIEHIVFSGQWQTDFGGHAFGGDGEFGDASFRFRDSGLIIAIVAKTETDTVGAFDAESFFHYVGLCGECCKLVEAFDEMLSVTVNVQVVGIDGIDDADVGMELQERAVVFIGFNDEHFCIAVAEQEIAVEVVGNASNEGRGGLAAFVDDMGGHCRCRGLSVSAGNGYGEQ